MTAESFFPYLLDVAIKSSVLMILVGLCIRFFAHNHPALRALLWSQTFVALLIVPLSSFYLPALQVPVLPKVSAPIIDAPVLQGEFDGPVFRVPNTSEADDPFVSPPLPPNPIPQSSHKSSSVSHFFQNISYHTVLLSVYIGGVFIATILLGMGFWRVHRLRRSVHHFGGADVLSRLDAWCVHLGVSDRVDIGISDCISVPTVVGIWHPLIIVPKPVAENGSDADWDGILVHELAHIKRRDAHWNLLSILVSVLYWYQPFVYWARRDLDNAREYACDDWAVHTLGDSESYAQTLMEVTARTDRRLAQALSLDMARTSRVLHRVNRVLNLSVSVMPKIGRLMSGVVCGLMVMCAGLLGSLRPVAEDDIAGRVRVDVESGDEAAIWVRQQFFLHDYVLGYREGKRLMEQFPEHAQLKAWYVLNLFSKDREAGQGEVATMPQGDVWTDFAQAYVWRWSRKEEALQASARAYQARPNDPDFMWLHAQVLWKAQGADAALAFIDMHIDRVFEHGELLATKAHILADQVEHVRNRVLVPEQMAEAFHVFQKALRVDPNNVSALLWHAFYLSRMQREVEAYPIIKHAAQISPHSEPVHLRYWFVTLAMPNLSFEAKRAEIEADMDLFLKGREHYPEMFSTIANVVASKLKRPEKLQMISNHIVQNFPESPEAEFERARQNQVLQVQMFGQDADPKAREDYRKKVQAFIDHSSHQDTQLLGRAYGNLFHVVRQDSTVSPKELLRVVQGVVQYKKDDLEKAYCHGPVLLAERTPYFREAEGIVRQGFEAVRQWEKKSLSPTGEVSVNQNRVREVTAGLHDALGWVYFHEGRVEEAEAELLKAHEMAPEHGTNLQHLGQFYTHLKDWDRAESFYMLAMTLYWQNPFPKQALQQLYQKRYGTFDGVGGYLEAVTREAEKMYKTRVLAARATRPNPVPMFLFECLDGSVIYLDDLHGKVVVIDVAMRLRENRLDDLEKVVTHFSDRDDVVILHVNLDTKLEAIAQSEKYKLYLAKGHQFVKTANIKQPTTWFLDRQGHLAYDVRGWSLEDIWRIEALLEEAVTVN